MWINVVASFYSFKKNIPLRFIDVLDGTELNILNKSKNSNSVDEDELCI